MTTLDKMLQGLANALGASLSTLTTTAKTVVGAINELKSGLTTTNTTVSGHTSTIGSGALDTTSQTLIGAVNELFGQLKGVEITHVIKSTSSASGIYHELYSSPDKAFYIVYSPGGGSWMHSTGYNSSTNYMHAGIANACGYRPWGHYGWTSNYGSQSSSDSYLKMNSGGSYYVVDNIAYLQSAQVCFLFPTHDTPNDFVLYGWHTANNNPYNITYDFYVIKIPIVS